MGYSAAWKVLEQMITDFRKRGLTVPVDIISDLRSAKTLINVLKADPSRIETSEKIEIYLRIVESYLVSEGQKTFGADYVDEWLKHLNEESKRVFETEEKTRFIPGLPREQKWIRIKPLHELPIEKIKELADELSLSCDIQNDGCLLVYGEDERVKGFVKKWLQKVKS
jgi:hypothetical protein